MSEDTRLVNEIKGDLESIIGECKHMIGQLDRGTVPLGELLQNTWSLYIKIGRLQMLRDIAELELKTLLED